MSVLIGGVYWRPNASVEYMMELHDFLRTKANARTKLVLTCDFHLAGIDWDILTFGTREKECCKPLVEIMYRFSLPQLVNYPTRQQGDAASVQYLAYVSNTLKSEIGIEADISCDKIIYGRFLS